MGANIRSEFKVEESGGFTGVFSGEPRKSTDISKGDAGAAGALAP